MEHIAMIAGDGWLTTPSLPSAAALFRIDVWKPRKGDLVADGVLTAESLSAGPNDGRATLTLTSGESLEIELSDIHDQGAAFTVLDPVYPKLL
ncbi:hypothetical protein G3545_13965 [Starkeya sp. ORNL1]|uniref:hypothetical protein n=1 Tax=Starkeya sp. ORNL1 TaxID=2709380 RepID=UPI0014647292|nr:hypothetical protein [Starkeya sp. ORNL1]QJP14649.1 hypothetical protein G3545_13965 [Starkeya sp. ORNL1]